ncbi:MAG TPA: hypothetical protein VGC53_06890 [Vicinamibacteria bacterium]|jgi:hypothetical protein
MRLGRLNEAGIEKLSKYLDSLRTDTPEPYPASILTDAETSQSLDPPVEIVPRSFANRFEAARYLNEVLARSNINAPESDQGLWAWLALFYFDQLCPPGNNGRRRSPGERARWIPVVGDSRRYYRHLLAGPYNVLKAHEDKPERTMALLCGPLYQISGAYEELAARQELITNPAVVAAATRLYYDPTKGRLKRAGTVGAPGTVRRFAEVLMQLDVVWDLYQMSPEELIAMLPPEFDRFRR